MATIHSISIKNFRGIKEFNQSFYKKNFICLIGRGDSGKSTILEAISLALSPSWNITFYDNDFYNCNTSVPIEIETTLIDLPETFLNDNKFGLYIRGINDDGNIVDDLLEEDVRIKAITIRLTITENLEPNWSIINERPNQEPIPISTSMRAKLNTFLISDYTERHFSWSKGNPLYSLLKLGDNIENEEKNIVINALRSAKSEIDKKSFNDFKEVIKKVSEKASELGIDISNATTSIDFKDISIKDNRVCLHDEEKIPLRLKGKGIKRLISIAIQTSLTGDSGIILIDEVEQGLEPDRVKHLVNTLKKNNKGQIFITTHSSNVVEELEATDLFIIRKGNSKLLDIDTSLQGCVRKNPNSLFANKIIVCEGKTEIGICRALNNYQISKGKDSIAKKGIVITDGTGSNLVEYSKGFKKLDFPVCLLCDSDDTGINTKKESLKALGIIIVDCDTKNSIEKQFFNDLPWEGVKELIQYIIEEKDYDSVKQLVQNNYSGTLPDNWLDSDSIPIREALANASVHKIQKSNGNVIDKSWFKRIDHGEIMGEIICKNIDNMNGKKIKIQIKEIINFIC